MDKSLTIAIHEFKVNLRRKEYIFFAFVLPAMLLLLVTVFSLSGKQFDLMDFRGWQQSNLFFAFPSTIAMIFSLAIFLSANFLLQGIAQEKENKIMEVLLSSISFRQLLTGKILGLAMLGLIQFFSWVAVGLVTISVMAPDILTRAAEKFVATEAILLYFIFFILGYILYASLLAAIGALIETRGEAQQIGGLLTVFMLIPAISTMFLSSEQASGIITALTLFPLTAPITAMIRIFMRTLPMYEAIASIAIMIATIIVMILATARLFRVELLMQGKRFSAKELIRIVVKGK